MKNIIIFVLVIIIARLTLPSDSVSMTNVSIKEDASLVGRTALATVLTLSPPAVEDLGIVKFAGLTDDTLLVGMPFTGKYYAMKR